MSVLDSFFNKGAFKAAKCKTLLKLTIPRIKLLRNRREVQLKQMRRDIAKLLETGQEATARIRVEHIIREDKMMAAQEIIELFCELIVVRLPIIEAQRECPLDLKEAISSLCFAAPRCSDLTELLQVQMLFAAKYGKEFVASATELMPECGVNRQLIELLSVRAPAPDVKLKLLKEIAEEYELDWDPTASEAEMLKPHEDLLNGPTEYVSGSTLPLSEGKQNESSVSASAQPHNEPSDKVPDFDTSDFPQVPNAAPRPTGGTISAPQMLPFPPSVLSDSDDDEPENPYGVDEKETHNVPKFSEEKLPTEESQSPKKQFLPFMSPPPLSSASFSVRQDIPPSSIARTKSEAGKGNINNNGTGANYTVDLQDLLAAAEAAAESAERAATAARSAASLVQVRINELDKGKNNEGSIGGSENPFHAEKHSLDNQNSSGGSGDVFDYSSPREELHEGYMGQQTSSLPSFDEPKKFDSTTNGNTHILGQENAHHQPQRLPSMDEDPYFSYPNLFTPPQGSNHVPRSDK